MVRSLWPNSCMLEPLQTWQDFAMFLGKIISWSNLARYLGRIRCEPWKDSHKSESCKAILACHPRYFQNLGKYSRENCCNWWATMKNNKGCGASQSKTAIIHHISLPLQFSNAGSQTQSKNRVWRFSDGRSLFKCAQKRKQYDSRMSLFYHGCRASHTLAWFFPQC